MNSLKVFWQFEELVAKILKANGFSVDPDWPFGPERGFDFLATIDNDRWAIEAKYYRTERAQPALLDVAAERLSAALEAEQLTNGMLVVSCVVDPAARLRFEESYGILVCGRGDLSVWARRSHELSEQLTDMLESWNSPFGPNDGTDLHELIKRPRTARSAPRTPPESRGTQLCSELRSLKAGAKTWTAYEKLCETILKYLFSSDLHGWHRQMRTEDGFNRFDYVCRIRPRSEFWHFVVNHLNSRYVLFEFKNYAKRIRQGQILTTEKYLLERGLRRVGIIVCRSGNNEGAEAMRKGAMREHGKLILVISDEDVCKMLHMKQSGEDPSDMLFEIADDFLLKLPR